ncbi:MAG: ATP-dependent DNA helicase RecG, partial [Bacteroidaceae bacterium]|nr:ATP-dependent DNA helicase RecG [Bacteroidaceae bacterium]
MPELSDLDIKYLPGVGPKRAELLARELGIRSYRDLLYYFPYKYIDRSKTYRISEINGSMPYIQLRGRIISYTTQGEGARRRLIATFSDGTGTIDLVWFKGIRYVTERYKTGVDYTLFGKPTLFNGRYNIAHPEIDLVDDIIDKNIGLQGYYTTTERMKSAFVNSKTLHKMIYSLWNSIHGPLEETLTPEVIERARLMGINDALCYIHFPRTVDDMRRAQFRLKFEELFYLQLHILRYARMRTRNIGGFRFARIGEYFNRFYSEILPFSLTDDQKQVLRDIRADVGSGRQMNRLLQGDVGSGKTIVALMTALM